MKKLSIIETFSGIGCQRRGIENTNLFKTNVVATSDIDKDAIVSYASIHCGLTKELIKTYSDYPSKEQMIKELKGKHIGFNFEKNKEYDWDKLSRKKTKDLEKYWLAVYLSNNLGDICNIKTLPYADLLTYSSPCTDYSIAGKQEGSINTCNECGCKFNPFDYELEERYNCPSCKSDNIQGTRSGLLKEIERLLVTQIHNNTQPKYLLLENVPALVSKKFKPDFDAWCRRLENLGYNNYYQLINGKECGVPQNRLRIFMLSIRKDIDNGKFEFPKPFDNGLRLKDVLEDDVDGKYYLSKQVQDRFQVTDETFTKNIIGTTKPEFRTIGQRDLVYQENSIMGALIATDYKQPKQIIETNRCIQSGNLTGGKWDKIYESARRYYSTEGVSPTLHTCGGGNTETKIIEDQTYVDNISDKYSFAKRKAQQMLNENGKLPEMFNPYNNYEVTDYAPTQTACCDRSASTATVLKKDGTGFIRKLTPKECWKLMGLTFEDCNKARNLGVADCNLYKQAGNGIITNCVELIMEHLYKAQYNNTYICTDENFTQPQVD